MHEILLFLGLLTLASGTIDKEMTLLVQPGTRNCLFFEGKAGETLEMDYQVINGGHGDMDISFEIAEANGKILVSDFKRSDNMHRISIVKNSDYRVCFDNTHSTFNQKTVFFDLITEREGESASLEAPDYDGLAPEEVYDVTVEQINDSIFKVKTYLTKAKQFQDMLRAYEAIDRHFLEQNLSKVNVWSFLQICLMLVVGALQVFMVRSLFDTESKAHKLWDKLNKKFQNRY